MWTKIKKVAGYVFNNILVYGLTEIVKQFIFIMFGTSIAALIAGFLGNFKFLSQYRIWLIFLFGIVGAIISVILFRKFTPIITVYKSIEGDYKILKDELYYEYLSKNEMIFRKKTQIKTLKKDISKYNGKYLWTGCGEIKATCETPEYMYQEMGRNDVYVWYEVLFGKYMNKKEVADFQLKWELKDLHEKAIPILSAFIIEPIKQISLNLNLPLDFNVKQVICEEFDSVTTNNKAPMKTFTKELSEGKIEWTIDRPKLFHRYSIRWDQ